jgi:fatty acid desaturase
MAPSDTLQSPDSQQVRPPRPQGWWAPQIERARIARLLRKRDTPGLLFFSTWLVSTGLTTWLLLTTWGTVWVAPALILHGAVLSFAYAASHEGAHGTAFQTPWLNEVVFYLTSFVFGEEPMYRRYSHGRHHLATWYPGFDSQMPYRNPMSRWLWLRETLAIIAPFIGIGQMMRHARGMLNSDERSFVPADRVRQLVWGSRLFLAGYGLILASPLVLHSAFVLVAFFGGRLAGGWVVQLFINSQHMCMSEAVPDHRFSTRSLICLPPTRVLYWNMNFHIEHHLYPGVPFHALAELNGLIKHELPAPTRGAVAANLEILRVIGRQAQDPSWVSQPRFELQQVATR